MLSAQERKLLQMLLRMEYITANSLAEYLGIGVKTVRTRIKELNPVLEKDGVQILSKPRYGYFINEDHKKKIKEILAREEEKGTKIPATTSERTNYLLAYLLNQKEYVKADNLCKFLYISKGTLTNTLKQVEEIYRRYHISIEKKPNYGIKVKGREFDIRQCMMDTFVKKDGLDGIGRRRQEEEIQTLGKVVYQCSQKYGIEFSEISYNDFVEHIYIALRRIRQQQFVEPEQIPQTGGAEQRFIDELVAQLEALYAVVFSKAEREYLALHLAGKSIAKDRVCEEVNFVIQSELDELVEKMLRMIYREFQVDFRGNLELRMNLNHHLVPLSVRLRYQIFLRNPMLEEIKKNYIFAYTIASQASAILKEYYECEISEDEIGELAEIFELALEQQNNEKKKFSILIVCASGKSSSQLLKYRYSQEFKEYIQNIYVCNLYEVEDFAFEKVDYVFATVPITCYVPVPILEVSSFLKEQDVAAVRKLFEQESRDFLRKYYRPELFFTGIRGITKEEVLLDVCRRMAEELATCEMFCESEELYESVLRREELSPTDYGNLVAIPHPDKAFLDHTFVAVAVLDTPVYWSREVVQVIILTVIGKEEDPDIQKFYETTTDLLLRPEDIGTLIQRKNFETLIGLLKK